MINYTESLLPFHHWIGYQGSMQWHLRLAFVTENFTRTSWPVGDDIDLAKEELRYSSCLEF